MFRTCLVDRTFSWLLIDDRDDDDGNTVISIYLFQVLTEIIGTMGMYSLWLVEYN